MSKNKKFKDVRVFFHYLTMTYSLHRDIDPKPTMEDCAEFFTNFLRYMETLSLIEKKQDFVSDDQVVWLDRSFIEEQELEDKRKLITFKLAIKSAKYNQVRNVRDTITMKTKDFRKAPGDGDDESTYYLISYLSGQNSMICVQESNYYGIRIGKFTTYLRTKMEQYRASFGGQFDFWFEHTMVPCDEFLQELKHTRKIRLLSVYTDMASTKTFVDIAERPDLRDEVELVLRNPRRGKYIEAQTVEDYYSAMGDNKGILRIRVEGEKDDGGPFVLDTEGVQKKMIIHVKLLPDTFEVDSNSFFFEAQKMLYGAEGLPSEIIKTNL